MWVYNDKLQIEFTFRSGPMIFGRVMALGLWNLAKYLVVTTFFHYAWRLFCYALIYWFGMWVYNDKLQIMFMFRSGPMIFGWVMALGLWNLAKYLVVTNFFRYAGRYWLDFWYESIIISYKSTMKFVPVEWFLANFNTDVGLWNLTKYLVVTTLFHYDLRYWLDFWYESVDS
jgi:hypothetical protein